MLGLKVEGLRFKDNFHPPNGESLRSPNVKTVRTEIRWAPFLQHARKAYLIFPYTQVFLSGREAQDKDLTDEGIRPYG